MFAPTSRHCWAASHFNDLFLCLPAVWLDRLNHCMIAAPGHGQPMDGPTLLYANASLQRAAGAWTLELTNLRAQALHACFRCRVACNLPLLRAHTSLEMLPCTQPSTSNQTDWSHKSSLGFATHALCERGLEALNAKMSRYGTGSSKPCCIFGEYPVASFVCEGRVLPARMGPPSTPHHLESKNQSLLVVTGPSNMSSLMQTSIRKANGCLK